MRRLTLEAAIISLPELQQDCILLLVDFITSGGSIKSNTMLIKMRQHTARVAQATVVAQQTSNPAPLSLRRQAAIHAALAAAAKYPLTVLNCLMD